MNIVSPKLWKMTFSHNISRFTETWIENGESKPHIVACVHLWAQRQGGGGGGKSKLDISQNI